MRADLDRRGFLLLGGGVLLAGCTSGSPGSPATTTPATTTPATTTPATTTPATTTPSATVTPSPSTSPTATLPQVTRWQPDPNDLSPRAKATAVRAIERSGNGARTALQVIDAQYGGLLTGSASVLVVTRTWRRRGGRVLPGGHTYDVRLTRGAVAWRVTDVFPSRPGAAGRLLSSDQRAVLGSDRIELPPAAAADIRSGQVHPTVLEAMRRLSERHRIGVSVVRSGHPIHVFGTDRLSDHPRGRAFDTFRIDGRLVVDRSTPRALVTGYMESAAALGSYNVGGPYLLGSAPQYFSDNTHHDHVHAGFAT